MHSQSTSLRGTPIGEDVRVRPTPDSGQPAAPSAESSATPAQAGRLPLNPADGRNAARIGWDADAQRYQHEHGDFLTGPGQGDLVWSPEGWLESELGLLGPSAELAGRVILDLGCGAAQAARWLARQAARAPGGRVLGVDVSRAQLEFARVWHVQHPDDPRVDLVHADAHELPIADGSIDVIVSAFGVLAFVPDLAPVLCEVSRVLRSHGHVTISLPHPVRWIFPDDPVVTAGLTVTTSYFDRTPYAEISKTGLVTYAEYHHTLEDLVTASTAANLVITRLWEPQWRGDRTRTFGGWSAETVDMVPKTLIVRLEHR